MEMRAIKSAFSTAVRWELLATSPFQKVALPKIPQTATKYLTREKYLRLRTVIADHWLGDLVDFAVLTGVRRREILGLKWSNIDLSRRVICIQTDATFKTKMGRLRVVPLADAAIGLLNRRKVDGDAGYVFLFEGHPFNGDHVICQFRKFARQATLSAKVNYHSSRHTHASWLVQAGVSIYHVWKILGHSSVEVTRKHYASLEPSELELTSP